MRALLYSFAMLAAGGCAFNGPVYVEDDDVPIDAGYDAPPDTMIPDTMIPEACAPDTIVCDDVSGVYVDCGPTGEVEVGMDCPLGCASGVEKCLDVDPSNDLADYLDMATSSSIDLTLTGGSTINTTNGAIATTGNPTVPTALVNGLRVFMVDTLTVSGNVKVTGMYPVVFMANGDVSIQAIVDVSADRGTRGPGAVSSGSCAGTTITAGVPNAGAGGAGHAGAGAGGGNSGDGDSGGNAGSTVSDQTAVPLQGGCSGGTVQTSSGPGANRASGGGGGGAIQITSRTSISLTGSGAIDASGGGGSSNGNTTTGAYIGGGGGGSGGTILLEAPVITLDGASVALSTVGGGGAADGNSSGGNADGDDGAVTGGVAAGGASSGRASGGDGADEFNIPDLGGNGSGSGNGGGGGGQMGRVRFNNLTGSITLQGGAAVHSFDTKGTIATRQVP